MHFAPNHNLIFAHISLCIYDVIPKLSTHIACFKFEGVYNQLSMYFHDLLLLSAFHVSWYLN